MPGKGREGEGEKGGEGECVWVGRNGFLQEGGVWEIIERGYEGMGGNGGPVGD